MLFINGKQYLEGIDCINMLICPYLYDSLDLRKQLDPRHKITIFSTMAKIPLYDGTFAYKPYHYLHISGEYINPEMPIKESIVNAVSVLIRKQVLKINDKIHGISFNEISKETISKNLAYLIVGISGIEFCFDFEPKNIIIPKTAKIINTSDSSFPDFLKKKLRERPNCLIKEESTYYSYDYNKRRKSTLKLYDRELWLLKKKGKEYPKDLIINNPYKLRIEFVFKRHYNTPYLTINNIEGNYSQIIEKFIPYLAKLYAKYFFGKILVDPSKYPYFHRINDLAYSIFYGNRIRRNNFLENYTQEKKRNNQMTDFQKYYKLMNELSKNKKKNDKLLENPPNSYFFELNNTKNLNALSPFDTQDKDKIEFQDGEFTFFKDNWINPKMRIIDNDEDENQ